MEKANGENFFRTETAKENDTASRYKHYLCFCNASLIAAKRYRYAVIADIFHLPLMVFSSQSRMTPEETILWKILRSRQFHDLKFRRQVTIGRYVVDFLCFEHSLIVEIDGGIHITWKGYDREREKYLRKRGYKILRFKNKEVHQSLPHVLKTIANKTIHKTKT